MINVGAAVAYGYLTTLATSGSGAIPKEYGFFTAYMIGACCMAIALFVFVLGTPRYRRKLPAGNSLRGLIHYLGQNARTLKGFIAVSGWIVLLLFLVLSVVQAFITDHDISAALSYTALALAAYSCIALCVCHMRNHDIRAMNNGMNA